MKTKQNSEGSREGVFGKSSRVAREGLPEKVAIEYSEGTNDMVACRKALRMEEQPMLNPEVEA